MGELRWEALQRLLQDPPLVALAEVASRHDGLVALVGGAVRDAMLGLPVDDLDLVVQGDQAAFCEAVTARLGRRPVAIGDAFQDTHRVHVAGRQIDIARCLGTLEEDLQRRDFTINALAVPLPSAAFPAGLVDRFDGQADLGAGIVRMTSPGVLQADPVRLMRAVRYAATLPGFRLDPATHACVTGWRDSLGRVARERVQYEWSRILAASNWAHGVELADQTGLLAETLGVAQELRWVKALGHAGSSSDPTTRLAALLLDIGAAAVAPVGQRLASWRWPRRQARNASQIADWSAAAATASEETAARWALREPDNAGRVADLLEARARGQAADPLASLVVALRDYVRRARESRWVTGADLLGWGMTAGPELGESLRRIAIGQLLRRWASPGECRGWVREQVRAGAPL